MPNKPRKKKPRSLKGLSSRVESAQASEWDRLLDENSKAIEESFHIEDDQRVGLPSPRLPVLEGFDQHKLKETDAPKENSFKKRFRALTSASAKPPAEASRKSWETKSSPAESPGVSSSIDDSITTQDISSPLPSPPSVPTIKTPKGKARGENSRKVSASPGFLNFVISPHDYTMIDLDYCEAQAAMNIGSDEQPDPVIGRSSFEELLAYLRRETGTEVRAIDVNDPKVPRRPNESRAWDHRNLKCVDCHKECPICKTSCCVNEEVIHKTTDKSLSPEDVDKAKRLLEIIDFLGVNAQDVSTFSQCTPPDGCGRYVCPSCCGVCPNEICRDIQCKCCKPNVWKSCDWHD